ncbi:MAG: type II secretion system protein [Verrucomicrobia bacterium]|jgi:prepilin-type N-terminal cleavage/methylation domain-containing protein|nr:type II secretion system protein [Verrucomicrobiota bacterium]NDD57258.1 type II secretion system protein [Verrucomicrobiota bacterium]NDD82198.1 type II secretion system protein [Verrucomicrobiota bacterium]
MRNSHGFTLVELLVTVAIIGLLAGLGNAAYQKASSASRQGVEISAARNLGQALQVYSQDNDGLILPGYLDPRDARVADARNDKGQAISPTHAAQRYPWRLLPYMNYQVRGGIWVNKLASQIPDSDPYRDYLVSLVPTLGMNITYVGGDVRNIQAPGRCVTRMNRVAQPSRLIGFASAQYEDPSYGKLDGYFEVRPPTSGSSSGAGLSTRYGGKTVAVMLDGHAEVLSLEQLKDMRRWCNEAAIQDNPNWTP